MVCGPVFSAKSPSIWFSQNDELRAAVPDALFKIVAGEESGKVQASAYLVPHMLPQKNAQFSDYATTVGEIESVTRLDFFTALDRSEERMLELWSWSKLRTRSFGFWTETADRSIR